ncbi:MAG: signal peptidase I [Candidatus Lindowbacteria bacterium]|nr:signal peptidase I [Candidatus Lindowbacteria bacterium]
MEIVFLAALLATALRLTVLQAFYIPSTYMEETLRPYDHILVEKVSYTIFTPKRDDIIIFGFEPDETPRSLRARPIHGSDKNSEDLEEAPREFVKRVIGVPGDEIDFSRGELRINGEIVSTEGKFQRAYTPKDAWAALHIPGRNIEFINDDVLVDGQPLKSVLPEGVPIESIEDLSASNFIRESPVVIGILKITVPKDRLFVMGDNTPASIDSRFFGFVPVSCVRGRALFTYWPLPRWRTL